MKKYKSTKVKVYKSLGFLLLYSCTLLLFYIPSPAWAALIATGTYLNNYGRSDGGANTSFPTGNYTVAMWVKHTGSYSVATTIFQCEISTDYMLGTTSAGAITITANGVNVVTGGTVTANVWKYVALTHTGTTFQIWMGDESTAVTSQGSATNAKATVGGYFRFFADDWLGQWFDGAIAYPRIWNVALSGAEIEAERTSTTPVKSANIWSYWDFSTASATIVDSAGIGARTITKAGTVTTTTDPTISGGGGPSPSTIVHRRIAP